MVTGTLAVLAIIVFMITESTGNSMVKTSGDSGSPAYGAYLCLICGIAVVAAGFLIYSEREVSLDAPVAVNTTHQFPPPAP